MTLEKEDGFYLGTTSIGYVVAIVAIVVPVCILVIKDILSVWTGVAAGVAGSLVFTIAIYPFLLGWVIGAYFAMQPKELPVHKETNNNSSATN